MIELPEKFNAARLLPSKAFHPEVLELCKNYVINWLDNREYGIGMVLAGPTGLGKSYAMAATARAIYENYKDGHSIRSYWFSAAYSMHEMLDARHFRNQDKYYDMWNKLTTTDFLVVDDLLHVSEFQQAKQLLMSVYESRDQKELPTLTTMNSTFSREDYGQVAKVFNEPFARKLLDNCSGYILSA